MTANFRGFYPKKEEKEKKEIIFIGITPLKTAPGTMFRSATMQRGLKVQSHEIFDPCFFVVKNLKKKTTPSLPQ